MQLIANKETKKVICTHIARGKRHDFAIFKNSKVRFHPETLVLADLGYLGIHKYHSNSLIPIKKSKNKELSQEKKRFNTDVSKKRINVEHVFASIKVFKIVSDVYRNRAKRFDLRFNLIAAIHNLHLIS